jgi:enoyl-CoA hydratase/carnithine racemase
LSTQSVHWTIENPIDAVIIECLGSKMNSLDEVLLDALEETADDITGSPENITAVVALSGKNKGFIAGADINIIKDITERSATEIMARHGQKIF